MTVLHWSTEEVPPAQRFDFYATTLSTNQTPMSLSSDQPANFMAKMDLVDLGAVSLMHQIGSGNRASRRPSDLDRSTERSFHLLASLNSSWTVDHLTRLRLAPGEITLVDSSYCYEIDLSRPYEVIHLKLSEAWLRQWLPSPGVLVGRPIGTQSGWGRALTSFMLRLSPRMMDASPVPTSTIVDHVGALLALLADEMKPVMKRHRSTVSTLRDRIVEAIRQRCTDSDLTAQAVATTLGISTRTLHRSLAAFGQTWGAVLTATREDLAVRMLESPLYRHVSIAEIGRRNGFADPSHFARVVRSRRGLTPTQLRRRHGLATAEELSLPDAAEELGSADLIKVPGKSLQ